MLLWFQPSAFLLPCSEAALAAARLGSASGIISFSAYLFADAGDCIGTGRDRHHRRQRPLFHEGPHGIHEVALETPFGAPSDPYVLGTLAGRKVAFLARHGRGHRILPSELNFRANIHGFKQLGVERMLSVSAVGSLKQELQADRLRGP